MPPPLCWPCPPSLGHQPKGTGPYRPDATPPRSDGERRVAGALPWWLTLLASLGSFGHQLSAALSCEAYALKHPAFRYVRSRHLELEHSPLEAARLLDFVNFDGGLAAGADAEPPVAVRPARYHGQCNGDTRKRPKCQQGKLVVCDNCYSMVDLPQEPAIRAELVRRIRARLARAAGGGAETCARRYDVCAHVRAAIAPRPSPPRPLTARPSPLTVCCVLLATWYLLTTLLTAHDSPPTAHRSTYPSPGARARRRPGRQRPRQPGASADLGDAAVG